MTSVRTLCRGATSSTAAFGNFASMPKPTAGIGLRSATISSASWFGWRPATPPASPPDRTSTPTSTPSCFAPAPKPTASGFGNSPAASSASAYNFRATPSYNGLVLELNAATLGGVASRLLSTICMGKASAAPSGVGGLPPGHGGALDHASFCNASNSWTPGRSAPLTSRCSKTADARSRLRMHCQRWAHRARDRQSTLGPIVCTQRQAEVLVKTMYVWHWTSS
mmetsp:Transcript_50061/g.127398  ORF Transcript_50061/g.127398 Transcript_50061/m.127398 type:complete len:224 (+) Transcript_50061:505-1176(+)